MGKKRKSEWKFCPKCGTEWFTDSSLCPKCNVRLQKAPRPFVSPAK